MRRRTETRAVSAKYYDEAYAAGEGLADLPFYLGLARVLGGPVLELGCGTGRVLLEIARVGIAIDGVDISSPMLRQLRLKLAGEAAGVRKRVSLFEGDMRFFRRRRKYSLIIFPFRALQHVHNALDQAATLLNAASQLKEGGRVAFDVYYPGFERLNAGLGQEFLEMEWRPRADPGVLIRRSVRKEAHNKIDQHLRLTFIFRAWRGEELVSEETEELTMSYYTYPQLRALFLLAGVEVAEEFGTFSKAPLDNTSREMIFILKKAR